MKTLSIVLVILFFTPVALFADRINLTTPEALSTPTSQNLDWYVNLINAGESRLVVQYRWLDATGSPIKLGTPSEWHTWKCEDECFSDVFTFQVREVDVGTSIGHGLRTLIWNKMRPDILTGANNGTFGE